MKISTEYPTFKKDNTLLSVITKSVQTTKKSVIGIPLIVKIHLILQFAARGRGKESLQRSLIKFHLHSSKKKENTIGWKMTFRKTRLIGNRPSSHLLRQRDKFGSQGFQPSKQTRGLVWFSVWQREYCGPWISRTEFIVLVEGKWRPFISCIRLCQARCLVLKTRRVKVKRDSSSLFKRCLPTSVSSPDWIPLGS